MNNILLTANEYKKKVRKIIDFYVKNMKDEIFFYPSYVPLPYENEETRTKKQKELDDMCDKDQDLARRHPNPKLFSRDNLLISFRVDGRIIINIYFLAELCIFPDGRTKIEYCHRFIPESKKSIDAFFENIKTEILNIEQ